MWTTICFRFAHCKIKGWRLTRPCMPLFQSMSYNSFGNKLKWFVLLAYARLQYESYSYVAPCVTTRDRSTRDSWVLAAVRHTMGLQRWLHGESKRLDRLFWYNGLVLDVVSYSFPKETRDSLFQRIPHVAVIPSYLGHRHHRAQTQDCVWDMASGCLWHPVWHTTVLVRSPMWR